MTAVQQERVIDEMYAAFYVLANLGFAAREISMVVCWISNAVPPGVYASVIVQRGELEFVLWVAPLKRQEVDGFASAWRRFADAQPTLDRAELDRRVESTKMWQEKARLIIALSLKGFALNEECNERNAS